MPQIVPGRTTIGNADGRSESCPRDGANFWTSPRSAGGLIGRENANAEAVFGADAPETLPEPPGGGFLTADGSRDSHAVTLAEGGPNGSPRAGTPYRRITWREIAELVAEPGARPKEDARLVVLSGYVEHDGRTHAVQLERGVYGGLAVDVDKGDPSLEDVTAAVRAALGDVAAFVYSSSSAEPGARKWRVLLPLATPIIGADYPDTELALFSLLEQRGLVCDRTLARTGQPVYLPNVPPKRRGPDGRPLFYQSVRLPGRPLELVGGCVLLQAREQLRLEREQAEAERIARAAAHREKRLAYVAATGDTFDPIEHFKATHTVAEMLARYGFEHKQGGRGSHWKSPLSESGSYSTEDRGDHWVTVSAWAETHNVGRRSSRGFRYGDAFDLFCFFEHKGDKSAAVRAYADLVRPAKSADVATVPAVVPPVRIETYETAGDPVPLDVWRRELEAAVALEAERPGLKLLRGAPGTGKTYAVARAMAGRSGGLAPKAAGVVSAPGHEFCGELVDELRSLGLDAAAYPKLDEGTCRNFETAQHAQSAGLPVTACVCSSCPHKRECREDGYLALVQIADKAPHKVCTHERLARAAGRLTEKAAYVTVEEDPSKLLRPSVSTTGRQLERVSALADDLADAVERSHILDGIPVPTAAVDTFDEFDAWGPEPGAEDGAAGSVTFTVRPSFFQEICRITDELAKRCRDAVRDGTPAGVHELELPQARDVPRNPEGAVWHTLEQLRRTTPGAVLAVPREALMLALYAATGRLERLYLQVDEDTRPGRPPSRIVHVIGLWRTALPWERVPVFVNDGTIDAETLEQLAGEPVVDVTPGGDVELLQPAEQYALDVLPTTSPARVGRMLSGIVRAHPDRERIGVVMLKRHREQLLFPEDGLPRLPADVLERITFSTHYGAGDDRGSNEFHRKCDLVIVLGTFRPPPSEVRRALVRRGQLEAANARATWGTVERRATGAAGELVTYGGRGYAERQWADAADGITRAAVRQAVGRARAICPDGVPVVLVSTENAGLPVRPADELPILDERADAVRAAIVRISETVSENAPPGTPENAPKNPIGTYRENGRVHYCTSAPPSASLGELLLELPGVPYATLRKWICRAIDAGELVREGSGRATRYRLVSTPAVPQSVPPPAAATPADEPPWLAAELAPGRHPATLEDLLWLQQHGADTPAGEFVWGRDATPWLVEALHTHAVEVANARGQPPPPVEIVARHTVTWHAVTMGAA